MLDRRIWFTLALAAVLTAAFLGSAHALIEKLTPLKQIMDDANDIFLANIESVDRTKLSMVMAAVEDYKGKTPFRRMTIDLTGDKEKHTPQFLKRIAPDVPVVVFLASLDKQQLGLAYTNGTWFQIIGQGEGANVRWQFTHCEIYLRRTFKGTTAEMQETVKDVLAGKRKPPPADPKEKPGFGPEIEEKKPGGAGALFAVVGLAFLGPIGALLQLLFPTVLRDQWQRYKMAVYVVLTLTTVAFVHYALIQWAGMTAWWLAPAYLWAAVVFVIVAGTAMAWAYRKANRRTQEPDLVGKPVNLEVYAMAFLAVAGASWAFYLHYTGYSIIDPITIIGVGAVMACVHLIYRRLRFAAEAGNVFVTTELAFLGSLLVAGAAAAIYVNRPPPPNLGGFAAVEEWPEYRGGPQRRGAYDDEDPGPSGKPRILWQFQAKVGQGKLTIHGSPVVVNDQVYFGALHEVLGSGRGILYCVSAANQRIGGRDVKAGDRLWQFNADAEDPLKPVFSPVTIAAGKLYFGEGYHQNNASRLFCLDAATGQWLWSRMTTSHVESAPIVAGSRVIFGAGDDGVICLDLSAKDPDDPKTPATKWKSREMHVDCSPLLIGNRVYAGSIAGDPGKVQDLLIVAIDRDSGRLLKSVEAPLPVCSSPSYAHGRLFCGLGNGKVNEDPRPPQKPAGAILCVDSKNLRRIWEYRVDGPVFGSPALMDDCVYFATKEGKCYCLKQEDGSTEVWKEPVSAPVVTSPVAAAGKIYVITVKGTIHCLNAKDGKELWSFDGLKPLAPDADVYSSLFLYKGRLYVGVGNTLACVGVE